MNAPNQPIAETPVAEVVALVIAAQLRQPIEDVRPEARLVADLSADELDILEIAIRLEDEYGIQVHDKDEPSLATVQGCVDLVNRKLVARAQVSAKREAA
ncbi:MAG TPA: acyl carrier protein [Roseateles sp.]|uniref:acyl carrier protein n=1 Tax=Roseateles sp. TaxID=1971397 RepID=UPI002EDA843F